MSNLSTAEFIRIRSTLAQALSANDVNYLGRTAGQAARLRPVTPHRLFFAVVFTLAGAKVESLADSLRAFNCQRGGGRSSTWSRPCR